MSAITTEAAARASTAAEGRGSYWTQLQAELEIGRLVRFATITVEFALVVAAVRLLNIETQSFELVLTLALAGFVVNHFLPAAWRQPFFALLSVASVVLVLGPVDGAWLLGIGGLLILLCHLPIAFWGRIAAILFVAGLLAADRTRILPFPVSVPATIWPILAAMFMFRLIVYLHDLRHGAVPIGPGRALGYFFMLPNVCFPLFPVVDYKTLQRSVYNDDALRLYQRGVKWMLRGLVHLALYKVVYFLAVIDPAGVTDGLGAARYMISTYLLYLKISGLFHMIVGLLNMYGFGLAETHHLYLFASSFTDFWRRINIYWKDFIQKIVFNPIYFGARRLGETGALVVATLIAFLATWLFHSYQWFWIRGEFPIVWSDLVFWLGLGVVVMVNVLVETRFGRRRSLSKPARTLREDVVLGLKIAATFASICVLWTIWSTPNVDELGAVWRGVLNSGPRDLAILVGVPLAIGVAGVLFGKRGREAAGTRSGAGTDEPFWRQAASVGIGASAFIAIALWPGLLRPVSPELSDLVRGLNSGMRLNATDLRQMQRGYYEDLGDVTRFNTELWTVYADEPREWKKSTQIRPRDDAMRQEFIPSSVGVFKGQTLTINSMGLRDREYPPLPAADTVRIALVGASHDMGAGVGDSEVYETIVEDRLNAEIGGRIGRKFEIMNFSFGGYTPVQKLAAVRDRILPTRPDLVLYVANSNELEWMLDLNQLQHLVDHDLLDQFPFVKTPLQMAGLGDERNLSRETAVLGFDLTPLAEHELNSRLAPYAADALAAVFQEFQSLVRDAGSRTALVLLEMPADDARRIDILDQVMALGRTVELPIVDLRGVYAGVGDRTSLWVAPWDNHTNAVGHRMLADVLFQRLVAERLLVPTDPLPAP